MPAAKFNIHERINVGAYESSLVAAHGVNPLAAQAVAADERKRLSAKFKADLLRHLGIEGHPKAEKLYEIAWDEHHSSGLREVAYFAEALAELLDRAEQGEGEAGVADPVPPEPPTAQIMLADAKIRAQRLAGRAGDLLEEARALAVDLAMADEVDVAARMAEAERLAGERES
jgi:hypothetical protein